MAHVFSSTLPLLFSVCSVAVGGGDAWRPVKTSGLETFFSDTKMAIDSSTFRLTDSGGGGGGGLRALSLFHKTEWVLCGDMVV